MVESKVNDIEKKEYKIADNIKVEFDVQYARGLLHWFADVKLKIPAVKNNLLPSLDPLWKSFEPDYAKYDKESLPQKLTSSMRVFGETLDYDFGQYYMYKSGEVYRTLSASLKFPVFFSEEDVKERTNKRIENIVDNLNRIYQLHVENDNKTKVFHVNYKFDKDTFEPITVHGYSNKHFDCEFIDFYEKIYYGHSSKGNCFGSYVRFHFPQVYATFRNYGEVTFIGDGNVLTPEYIAKIFEKYNLSSSFCYGDPGVLIYDIFTPLSNDFDTAVKRAEELKNVLCKEVVNAFKQKENAEYHKVKDEVI